jgi:hypothetical protein
MHSTRVRHGAFWGLVAAAVAAVVPLVAMALSLWPAQQPITAAAFGRLLGAQGPSVPLVLLAVCWQLLYSAFWGGVLAYVSGPIDPPGLDRASTLTYGVGVGCLRWCFSNLALLAAGWGPFALLRSPLIAGALLASDLLFGVTAGWLLRREDQGKLAIPSLRLRPRGWGRRLAT